MDDRRINFYGLLHIDRKRNLDANIKWAFADPVGVYVACASLLAASARANGMDFCLLTNMPEEVQRLIAAKGLSSFPIMEIQPSRSVPAVKNFYSAHFKLDAIRLLASGAYGTHVGLIDVDTVFCAPMPASVCDAAEVGVAAYDVSSDVFPLHWDQRIKQDLELVAATTFEQPKWYGGEFLVSTPAHLTLLSDTIEACWPRYIDNIKKVHHIGDEMAVSAALNTLSKRGFQVIDAGVLNIVSRWWSGRTKYRQPAFEDLENRALLHLPSDKTFFAEQANKPFDRSGLFEAYKAHVRRKQRFKVNPFDPWILARIKN